MASQTLADAKAGEDFPTVGRVGHVLGWFLWLGVPIVLIVAGVAFVFTRWPVAVLGIFLPAAVGMLAVAGLLWRHGATVMGWDNRCIHLKSVGGSEVVNWDVFDSYRKLWLTHKLEGGGTAWIAVLVKYRIADKSKTVLLTVSGATAVDSSALFPGRYKTVFDKRIPEKDWA